MTAPPPPPPEISPTVFVKRYSVVVFGMDLVEQLGNNSWQWVYLAVRLLGNNSWQWVYLAVRLLGNNSWQWVYLAVRLLFAIMHGIFGCQTARK